MGNRNNLDINNFINFLFQKYKIKEEEKELILKIIKPIIEHPEFQRRCTSKFLHHGSITLGEHILEDTIVTYKLSRKYLKNKNYNIDAALKIAMFHDLYTIPWQNNKEQAKVKRFFNKHGFRHPLEAVINAYTWYTELFDDKKIIIDGILHHMYPLPVTCLTKEAELKNNDLVKKLPEDIIHYIIDSTNRGRIWKISLARSKFKEGRIMAKADRYVSFRQIKNFSNLVSLLTGYNKKLKKNEFKD